jgi:hypothetical protein
VAHDVVLPGWTVVDHPINHVTPSCIDCIEADGGSVKKEYFKVKDVGLFEWIYTLMDGYTM